MQLRASPVPYHGEEGRLSGCAEGCLTGSRGAKEGARHTIVHLKDSAGEGGLGSANTPSMPSSWRLGDGDGDGVSLSLAVAKAAFVVDGRRRPLIKRGSWLVVRGSLD